MKLIEGMQVTVNAGDVGVYVGQHYVDVNCDGRTFCVLDSSGDFTYARSDEIEICDSPFNRQLISFAVEKLRAEREMIDWEIYELEAEERYDD